jgi:threonine/homoserine/homoserine lactone efflux protein
MIDPVLVLAFLPAAILLSLTPGPEMLFCLGRSLADGPRLAALSAVGMAVGAASGVLIAGFGLSALLEATPGAFDAIRWAGVAYLIFLAVRALREPPAAYAATTGIAGAGQAIGGGYLVSLLNPKGAVFVFALIPQFMTPDLPGLPQFLVLGGVLVLTGLAVNLSVALFAHRLRDRLLAAPRAARALRLAAAGVYGALAARLILEGRT